MEENDLASLTVDVAQDVKRAVVTKEGCVLTQKHDEAHAGDAVEATKTEPETRLTNI